MRKWCGGDARWSLYMWSWSMIDDQNVASCNRKLLQKIACNQKIGNNTCFAIIFWQSNFACNKKLAIDKVCNNILFARKCAMQKCNKQFCDEISFAIKIVCNEKCLQYNNFAIKKSLQQTKYWFPLICLRSYSEIPVGYKVDQNHTTQNRSRYCVWSCLKACLNQ